MAWRLALASTASVGADWAYRLRAQRIAASGLRGRRRLRACPTGFWKNCIEAHFTATVTPDWLVTPPIVIETGTAPPGVTDCGNSAFTCTRPAVAPGASP